MITPVLSQDVKGTTAEAESMTFRTLKGFNGSGVTFESVKYPGYYLTSKNGVLSMTQDPSDKDATFFVSTDTEIKSGKARKTKRMYTVGEELKTNDIRIQLYLETGKTVKITDYTTNADKIDMTTTGKKTLKVTYEYNGEKKTDNIQIIVVDSAYKKK